MTKLRDVTLVFLIKKSGTVVTDVCLAMKKRGFGVGRWNGVGGKVEAGDKNIEEAASRETNEEINVKISDLKKVAELTFYFPHNPAWDQLVHVYFVEKWEGEPEETEEMRPKWFKTDNLPFADMWPDDIFWLPWVLEGNLVKATFKFGEKDIILEKNVDTVEKL